MSQENVEIAQKILDAVNRRDPEAILPYADPGNEVHSPNISGAEGTIYRGHHGVRDWIAETDAAFNELRFEPEGFRALGDDVLTIGRLYARGRESGVEIDSLSAWLGTFRDGRMVRYEYVNEWTEALEAAGLSE
jgi:ketosteroid isomerase-like protein